MNRHDNEAGWRRILPSPFSYPALIYLPVTLPKPKWDEKSNLILTPNGFGYLHPITIYAMHNFFNKFFFSPERNVAMLYLSKRWWWSMTMVMVKREAESVRYERRKERTIIIECHLKDWDSDRLRLSTCEWNDLGFVFLFI